MDIIAPPTPPPVRQSRIAHYARSVLSLLMKNTTQQRIKIRRCPTSIGVNTGLQLVISNLFSKSFTYCC
eukprot:3294714-Rhodomonas_salina.1